MIHVSELLKKNYFETVSEYRLALSFAMECARRGDILSVEGVLSQAELNSRVHAGYKNYLIDNDLVVGFTKKEEDFYPYEEEDYSFLSNDNLFEDNGEYLYWDMDWGLETLGSLFYKHAGVGDIPYLLEFLVSRHLYDVLTGLETRKLYIKLTQQLSSTFSSYLDIVSLYNSCPHLSEYITIVLHERSTVDLNLSLFQYDSKNLGFNSEYTVEEKLNFLQLNNFTEGMVLVLFDRKGINVSNDLGNIEMAHLVRLDEVVDGKLYFTQLRGTRTYEETAKDFLMIPEKNRPLYYDLLDKSDSVHGSIEVDLRECGIGNRFHREKHLLDSISTTDMVTKTISNGGEMYEQEMSEAEAIFYTLMQNDAPIDAELFRNYYFNGGEGIWDNTDHTGFNSPYDFIKDQLDF